MLDKDIKMLKDINRGAKLIGDFLKDNKINITASSFFKYLRNNNYLISQTGEEYNMPTDKSYSLQLFTVIKRIRISRDGVLKISKTVKITCKGQEYFRNFKF